jgi:hypothetical protein
MARFKRIYIPQGYTTVWKRGRGGNLKRITVPRKGYFITRKSKKKKQ